MLRLGLTTAYILTSLMLLTGCSGQKKEEAPVADIKLGDLAPVGPIGTVMRTQTVAFDFYKLDLPAANIQKLSDIWKMLYTRPVRLADPAAFAANYFRLVYGESQMWDKTAEMLQSAGAKEAAKISMLLDYGQFDNLVIARIRKKENMFYFTRKLEIEPVKAEPGHIVLKINATAVPGVRGVCDLNATPVLMPRQLPTLEMDPTAGTGQVDLPLLGFTVQMSPGSFLLIGPTSYPQNKKLFSNRFFIPRRESRIRVYVIFCRSITD